MKKLLILLFLIPVIASGQDVLTKKYRTFVNCHNEWTDPLYDYAQSTTYTHDQNYEYDDVGAVVADVVENDRADIPELPETGTIERDQLYVWSDLVVRCRQTHQRTIYDPTETLALFTIYRAETADMPWIAGEQVDVGTIRVYNGTEYECIQGHITQENWTPDATPTLWQPVAEGCPDFVQPTGSHDAYNTGDCVTYNGQQYVSLIDANVWSPDAYPAGWELVE